MDRQPTARALEVLGCGKCPPDRPPLVVRGDSLRCPACAVEWRIGPHGAVNTLVDPSASVIREIDGMRAEKPDRFPTRESLMFQQVASVSRFADRIAAEDHAPKNYYRSTELNFRHAFERIRVSGSERVLEIGAEHDFPFLRPFQERGCECYATNLFFTYESDRAPGVQVVLGDMNRLPYRNGMFEIVVMSATSHHSPDLPGLIAELARIIRPGGIAVILNDPTAGLLKHAFDWLGAGVKKGGDRHELVNEHEYPAAQYRRLARAAGFEIQESFFSVYYDEKLRTRRVAGLRFATLARLFGSVWWIDSLRRALMRVGLSPGQALMGLELNLILRRHS